MRVDARIDLYGGIFRHVSTERLRHVGDDPPQDETGKGSVWFSGSLLRGRLPQGFGWAFGAVSGKRRI